MLPKAKHLKNLYALDLGTTKFCLATVQERPDGSRPAIDITSVAADGMRRGMVSNLEQAKCALRLLVEQAEQQFSSDIARVVVGVAGSHLRSRIVTESSALIGDTVCERDMLAILEKVEQGNQVEDRELLHTIPIGYRVDNRETVSVPLGFRGKTLAADFFLIDADRAYLRDIVELCNDSGLQVVRLYSEPFASASVTVPDRFKELGVAIADIGGGTTDGIVFRDSKPVGAFSLNVAGKLMTNDLAIGLSLPLEAAEVVKFRFGIKPRPEDSMEISDLRGQGKFINGAQVLTVLVPRIHELCAMLAHTLLPYRGQLGAGLILTGGGADVKGIADYFQSKLAIPVTRARPVLLGDRDQRLEESQAFKESPHLAKHATVIGLLNLELCRIGDQEYNRRLTWTSRYLGPLFNWLKELT